MSHKISASCAHCSTSFFISNRAYVKNVSRNGAYRCFPCSRRTYLGTGNPNSKHAVDTSFFRNIDTEEQAYILGLVASDGTLAKNTITIALRDYDFTLLEQVRDCLYGARKGPKLSVVRSNMLSLSINSKELVDSACELLCVTRGKKSDIVRFPKFEDPYLSWCFLRGYFDGDGSIRHLARSSPECSIASDSPGMLSDIKTFSESVGISCGISRNQIAWNGLNCLEFLANLYDDASIYLSRKRDLFVDWANWVPSLKGRPTQTVVDYSDFCIKFLKTRTDAVLPTKARYTDVGFDLTLLEKVKSYGVFSLYTTGIKCEVPYGFYFDLVARSSFHKTGYMLANNVGVIDPTYKGEILVPIINVSGTEEPLPLPYKGFQLILRRAYNMEVLEVTEFSESSARGENGFGSTGL